MPFNDILRPKSIDTIYPEIVNSPSFCHYFKLKECNLLDKFNNKLKNDNDINEIIKNRWLNIYNEPVNLISDICHCENFLNNNRQNCNRIISVQENTFGNNNILWHLPEPWSGDIINAPLLFISSNPSINPKELYPDNTWPDNIIRDFFVNRFKDRGKKYSWVYKNKVLPTNRNRGNYVRYWSGIQNRAKELFQRNVNPGIDYCITELVHCKSKNEIGVADSLNVCTKLYIERLISLSCAKVIVLVGKRVNGFFEYNNLLDNYLVLHIPHPNARVPRTFEYIYRENREIFQEAQMILQHSNIENDLIHYDLPTENEIADFINQRLNGE